MVQAIIDLEEHKDRFLTIVKGKFGFKNKYQSINFFIVKYEEERLEPQLRPEYIKKLPKIQKQKGISFKSVNDLRKKIENDKV